MTDLDTFAVVELMGHRRTADRRGHPRGVGLMDDEQRCICGHTSPEHPDDGDWYACGVAGCICTGWFGELWPLSDAERAELRDLDYGGVFAWFMTHDRPAA